LSFNTPIWDDGHWPGLPGLDGDLQTDACVIGLGGSGLTCVSELLAMGRRVVGIDAGPVAGGAAGRNGGFLRAGTANFHHEAVRAIGHRRALRIHELTVEEMQHIAEQVKGTVRSVGSLRLAMSDEEHLDCALQREAMRDDGLAVKNYNGPLGRGIYVPGDASYNPLARCRALAYQAMHDGALLFEHTRALWFMGDEVSTPRGSIKCERVIVAVDGRLETIVPELAGRVRTARIQMLATAPTREIEVPCLVSARGGFDFWQQLPDGSLVVGGGRDRAMDAEWTVSNEPTPLIQDYLESILRSTLRVSAPVTHRWAACASYTATGLPVLSEVRPGLWVVGGYSGTGNLLGALCARAAARVAFGEPSELATLLADP
jgi:glycine/D-amino acid oxidase-like deaminating enzyme